MGHIKISTAANNTNRSAGGSSSYGAMDGHAEVLARFLRLPLAGRRWDESPARRTSMLRKS